MFTHEKPSISHHNFQVIRHLSKAELLLLSSPEHQRDNLPIKRIKEITRMCFKTSLKHIKYMKSDKTSDSFKPHFSQVT